MQALTRALPLFSRTLRCTCAYSKAVLDKTSSRTDQRYYSVEAVLAPATPEGAEKHYAPKIEQIVQDISQLTLLEVADLNELLKKTLNITDAPVMAMGAAPMQAAGEAEEQAEVKQEQSLFTVKLTKFDTAKKVALIKEIKNLVPGLNLVQAKKFVESAPQDVKGEISKEEAEAVKKSIEAVGGTAEIE